MFKNGDKVLFLSDNHAYGPDGEPNILYVGRVKKKHPRIADMYAVVFNDLLHPSNSVKAYNGLGFWIAEQNLHSATLANFVVLYVKIPKKYRHNAFNDTLSTDIGRTELANYISGFPDFTKIKAGNESTASTTKAKKRTGTKRTTTSAAKSKRHADLRG